MSKMNKKSKRGEWMKDKDSPQYKRYLMRRNKSMKKAGRKRLDRLNKMPPEELEEVSNYAGKLKPKRKLIW